MSIEASTISPEGATSPVEITNPDGSKTLTTRAAVAGANGQGGLVGGKPTVPPGYSMGDGRYSGGLQSAPAAGVTEGLQTAGHASAQAYSDAQTRAAGFSQRQYQSTTALAALQKLGPTGTGPGTEGRNALVSYATSLGFTAPSDATKAYDEANKYLIQLAMSQPGASGSDSRLATALTGNASTHISNLAAQDVVRANIALDRQNQGALLAFQQLPQDQQTPSKWQTFATHWSSTVDPRVYGFDLMTPAQRSTMMKDMSPAQKATFYGQVHDAVAQGLVQPPQQPSASGPPQVPTQ